MRNVVICCDGTWNTVDERSAGVPVPTNVVRLYNALDEKDESGEEQVRYYHPGVGTDGSLIDKIKGGAFGLGLDKNIQGAYRWLAANYSEGDRIFLFGFSRGAFTARSLGGMIVHCGLLKLDDVPEKDAWKRVEQAYKAYRDRQQGRNKWADGGWAFHTDGAGGDVPIYFIGVWDTVGALGIPDHMALCNLLDHPADYAFHDTRLSDKVRIARHAVALDERRGTFTPTLWTDIPPGADVKQLWFPGVHCDVGGGYPETGLSDGALAWMIGEAREKALAFKKEMTAQIAPNPRGVLHDSCTGVFELLRTVPRRSPCLDTRTAEFHASVVGRRKSPPITQAPYQPTRILKPGESVKVPIFAARPWNETGIYLEAGVAYEFSAEGEWLDRDIASGPQGGDDKTFHVSEIVHLAGTLLGEVEGVFQRITGDAAADFNGTKREESMPWFALVGAIANGGDPQSDGSVRPHTTFLIGAHRLYEGKDSDLNGYLYCFANDAWHFYDNNHGSVTLTVKRPAKP